MWNELHFGKIEERNGLLFKRNFNNTVIILIKLNKLANTYELKLEFIPRLHLLTYACFKKIYFGKLAV